MESELDQAATIAESGIASAATPPTQYYTLHECSNRFKLSLVLLVGSVALGIVTSSGAAAIGVFNCAIAMFQFKKMEKAIRSEGARFAKPAPRVPKRWELCLWPPLFVLMSFGVIWLTKSFIMKWLLHPANSPLMFAFSVVALLYLIAAWAYLLWLGKREYGLYFAAFRSAESSADSLPEEARVPKSHWWTDTQAREEAKATVRR